jgi:hypothetical protein
LRTRGGHRRWQFISRSCEVLDAIKATIGGLEVLNDEVNGVHGDAGREALREELFEGRKDEIRFPSRSEVWRSSIFSICRLAGKKPRKAVRDLELLQRATEEEEATAGVVAQIDVVQSKSDHGVRPGRPGHFIHLEQRVREEEVRERAE